MAYPFDCPSYPLLIDTLSHMYAGNRRLREVLKILRGLFCLDNIYTRIIYPTYEPHWENDQCLVLDSTAISNNKAQLKGLAVLAT